MKIKDIARVLLIGTLLACPANAEQPIQHSRPAKTEGLETIISKEKNILEMFQQALKENKIPAKELPLHLAVGHIESEFDPYEVSRVGAAGVMQLLPSTADWLAKGKGIEDRVIYNPRWRGRKILYKGAGKRHSKRLLRRWYAPNLKRMVRSTPRKYLKKEDFRFGPYINILLGTEYIRKIKRSHFGRYKCYRSRGKKLCGTFSGFNASLLSGACYHLGSGDVFRLIAEKKVRSVKRYIRYSKNFSKGHKQDGTYLKRLYKRYITYRRLIKEDRLDKENVARIFSTRIAENLFRKYKLTSYRTADLLQTVR